MREAKYYKKEGSAAICSLCPHNCIIKEDKKGRCGVRKNRKGKLYSLIYGKPISLNLDPIEKKPLYHFLPSSTTLSFGTVGCNLKCLHCQNWQISSVDGDDIRNKKSEEILPQELIDAAKNQGCESIAFTYNEPTIFFEYLVDVAKIARKEGLKTVIVSNGFINKDPLAELSENIDAANIDLKSFKDLFYKKICKAKLKPVLETLKFLKQKKVHLEVTNLIIPTKNDDLKEIENMSKWIKNELGEDTPVHFSAFFPMHKMKKVPATDPKLVLQARSIARGTGLKYVYAGNIKSSEGANTICPSCGKTIIKRDGYFTENYHIKGKCSCGEELPGFFR